MPSMNVRVYLHGGTREFVGLALSADTLVALCEKGLLEADKITLKGRIDRTPVEVKLDERDVDHLTESLKVA